MIEDEKNRGIKDTEMEIVIINIKNVSGWYKDWYGG